MQRYQLDIYPLKKIWQLGETTIGINELHLVEWALMIITNNRSMARFQDNLSARVIIRSKWNQGAI